MNNHYIADKGVAAAYPQLKPAAVNAVLPIVQAM
jgi:hypothetical protein